jgi:hypothetical protein
MDRVGAGGSRLATGIFWQGPYINPGPQAQFVRALGFAFPRNGRSIGGRDGIGEGHRGAHRCQALVRALVDVLHLHEFNGMFLLVLLEVGLILESVVGRLLGADLVPLEADALIGVLPFQVVGGYRWSGDTEGIDLGGEPEPGLATGVDDVEHHVGIAEAKQLDMAENGVGARCGGQAEHLVHGCNRAVRIKHGLIAHMDRNRHVVGRCHLPQFDRLLRAGTAAVGGGEAEREGSIVKILLDQRQDLLFLLGI